MLDQFETAEIQLSGARLYTRWSGHGPPLLLLHGFPETHLMWRHVAPKLARHYKVVCVDLRGYGRSTCPESSDDHAPYSKRAMALDMAELMTRLGHPRFAVAGHDRGGRVAYRLALDHPERITSLGVLDILPTETTWQLADARFALAYWPWSLFAQPAPLPERVLQEGLQTIVDSALSGWGTDAATFGNDVRAAYHDALDHPLNIHAVCEEYRAAATLDRVHDQADFAAGRRIACPIFVLWAADGPLANWYGAHGGPLALWQAWAEKAERVKGRAIEGGHFFPESAPEATAEAMLAYLQAL